MDPLFDPLVENGLVLASIFWPIIGDSFLSAFPSVFIQETHGFLNSDQSQRSWSYCLSFLTVKSHHSC